MCVNPHLVRDLIARDLWNSEMKNQLMHYNGSVQNIKGVPDDLKQLYKTVWEIPQKVLLDHSINRAPFIC